MLGTGAMYHIGVGANASTTSQSPRKCVNDYGPITFIDDPNRGFDRTRQLHSETSTEPSTGQTISFALEVGVGHRGLSGWRAPVGG